jgi:hypothetical protein
VRKSYDVSRILAGLFGAFLLLGLAWRLFHTFATLPQFRHGGISDFAGFLGIGAIVYVGVTLGVMIRWLYAKNKGRVLTSKQVFVAGLGGVFGLSVASDVAMGFYGLYTWGSFGQGVFQGQGMLFGMSIAAVISGAVAAAGVTLILYCVSN